MKHQVTITLLMICFTLSTLAISVHSLSSVDVWIDPSYQEVLTGETFTVKVFVDPNGYGISGGEINLAFDPEAMQIVSVKSGNLLGSNPLVGMEYIDNKNGTFLYAMARVGQTTPPTPQESFIIIEFIMIESAVDKTYNIAISDVGFCDENFEDIYNIIKNNGSITWKKHEDTISPLAVAGPDQTVQVNVEVSFNASGSTDNVGIISYKWNFGDGTNSTGISTTHIYTNPGTYIVTLTVKDAGGNEAEDTLIITVKTAIPWGILRIVIIIGIVVAVAVYTRLRQT